MFLVNLLGFLLGNGCCADPYTSSLDLLLLIWFTNRQRHLVSPPPLSLMVAFCWARRVQRPSHSLFDVWLCDTKQRSGFTADLAGFCRPTAAWVGDISCPSLIKLPCVAAFESDTGDAGEGSGPQQVDPALMWQREKFAFIRPHVVRPGARLGCLKQPGCQVVTHSNVATSG